LNCGQFEAGIKAKQSVFMLGSSISHYRITGRLGAGGMGEVWRAHDGRLGRDVALKILPKEFAESADRLRRFQQEAKTLAALNHPNLLVIYDTGLHQSQPYLVSELLEGKTLRELLADGPLAQRQAVDCALQLAIASAAAHAKGIIHRDLKPENVFVTRDGRIKILDFGLAKQHLSSQGAAPQAAEEDVTAIEQTRPGIVLGTASYMSPEQVRGQPADQRSDLFALGAILFEMLSGERAFRKPSAAETMTAVLNEEPADLSERLPNLAPSLDRILRRCLQKDADNRFQSASDLAFALEALSGSSTRWAMTASARTNLAVWVKLGVAAVIASMFLAAALHWRQPALAPSLEYQQITTRRGTVFHARFAPGGQDLIYSARWGNDDAAIYSQSHEGVFTSVLLTNADLLSVSHSGELALLVSPKPGPWLLHEGTLARMHPGAAPRMLLDHVLEADWFPDGESMLVIRFAGGICRLEEYPSGKLIYDTAGYVSHARISPKGDHVAFMVHQLPQDDRGWAVITDRSGHTNACSGEWSAEEGLVWENSGKEIWFGASRVELGNWQLMALSTNGKERRLAGLPAACIPCDLSASGRLLLNRLSFTSELAWGTPQDGHEIPLSTVGLGWLMGLSPDGRRYLFSYQGHGSGPDYTIFLGNTDGSLALQLGPGLPLAVSPDGQSVVAIRNNPTHLVIMPTGPGEARTGLDRMTRPTQVNCRKHRQM
jgi:hypothetical protein